MCVIPVAFDVAAIVDECCVAAHCELSAANADSGEPSDVCVDGGERGRSILKVHGSMPSGQPGAPKMILARHWTGSAAIASIGPRSVWPRSSFSYAYVRTACKRLLLTSSRLESRSYGVALQGLTACFLFQHAANEFRQSRSLTHGFRSPPFRSRTLHAKGDRNRGVFEFGPCHISVTLIVFVTAIPVIRYDLSAQLRRCLSRAKYWTYVHIHHISRSLCLYGFVPYACSRRVMTEGSPVPNRDMHTRGREAGSLPVKQDVGSTSCRRI